MSILQYVLLTAMLIAALWRILWILKERYVGFGWVLEWRDDHLTVVSRLIESPSGEACVRLGSTIVEYAGERVVSWDQAKRLFERKVKKGESQAFRIAFDGKEHALVMKARTVQGPIPIYGPFTPTNCRRYDIVYGMRRCGRTGQLYETRRPNRAWQSLRGT